MHVCEQCGHESPTKRGLSIHITRSHDGGAEKKEYECGSCGDTFEDYPSRRETRGRENFYCSKECRIEGSKKKKYYFDCAHCGEEVVRPPSLVEEMGDYELKNHFCDKECESKYKQENWVGENHHLWKDNTVTRNCDECDSEIEVNQYYIGKLEHHFCDHDCHTEFQIEQKYDDCEYCGEEFELTPVQRMHQNDRHFCSKDHWKLWMSDMQAGEKNNAWRGGKEAYYGPNWNRVRKEVLSRDSYECQNCSMTRDEHYDQFGIDFDVHHIEPLRTFNRNWSKANNPENLITLCRTCHMKAEHGDINEAELVG